MKYPRYSLVVLMALSLSARLVHAAPETVVKGDSQVIVVAGDQQSATDLGNEVQKQTKPVIEDFSKNVLPKNFDLFALTGLSVGVVDKAKAVPMAEVEQDADKMSGDLYGNPATRPEGVAPAPLDASHEWTHYSVGGHLVIPAVFSIPGLAGPVGVNVGGIGRIARNYEFTIKSHALMASPDGELTPTGKEITGKFKPLGLISIPTKAEDIARKYAPGSEIIETGQQSITVIVGANVGVSVAQGNLNLFGMLGGEFRKHLKVLGDPNRTLIRYAVTNEHAFGGGVDGNISVGVTLFSTSLVNGVLSVNVVDAHVQKTKAHSITFDYTYDLSYPEARDALTAARKGDLRPSQGIATFHDEASRYRGVAINAERVADIVTTESSHAFGLLMGNSGLNDTMHVPLPKIGPLGNFLFIGTQHVNTETVETATNGMRETAKLFSFDYDQEKNEKVLWGLAANRDRVLHFKSQVIRAEETQPGLSSPKEVVQPKLSYSYARTNKRQGRHTINQFFDAASRIMGWKSVTMGAAVESARATGGCESHKGASFAIRGTLYGKAIDRVVGMNEADLWENFGEFAHIDEPEMLANPSTRARYLSKDSKEMSGQMKKVARKFERVFIPRWLEMKSAASPELRMKALRGLLEKYGDDITGFEFFTALAVGAENPEDVLLNVSLSSAKCNLSWSRQGPLEFSLDDIMKDW